MNTTEKKSVANFEEIQPHTPSGCEDAPLILFTLLGQMAVGGFWAMLWMFPRVWTVVVHDTTLLQLLPSLLIGLYLGAGMSASLAHLGTKKNAWHALRHLRRSWLSREILFTGLFGMGWLFTTLESGIWHRSTLEWMGLTAALGLGLVYSMAQVYRLPAVPAWNTWRTNAGFMVSALLLGQSVMAALLSFESNVTGIQLPSSQWIKIGSSILILLLVQLLLMRKQFSRYPFHGIRIGLILVGIVLTIASSLLSSSGNTWISILVLPIVLIEEGMGRWLFYQART